MTNQPFTFYRNHREDTGETYAFDLEADRRPCKVFVYSRRPLSPSDFPITQDMPLKSIVQSFGQTVLSKGEGGIIAATYDDPGRKAWIIPVTAPQQEVFETFGVLQPGQPLRFEPRREKPFDLPLGTHLFIPVDPKAEDSLRAFGDHLAWLPPDIESLVLTTIRKPSLDARVERLEEKASRQGKKTFGGGWRDRLAQLKSLVPTLLLAFNSLLLVAVLIAVMWSLKTGGGRSTDLSEVSGVSKGEAKHGRGEASDSKGGAKDSKQDPSSPVKSTDKAPTESQLRGELSKLLGAVVNTRNPGPRLDALCTSHFAGLLGKKEGDIEKILADPGSAQPALIGLIKLEILHLAPKKYDVGFFASLNNTTQLKANLRELDPKDNSRDLIATLACLAYGSSEALDLATDQCDHFPTEKAAQGLKELAADFVKKPGR